MGISVRVGAGALNRSIKQRGFELLTRTLFAFEPIRKSAIRKCVRFYGCSKISSISSPGSAGAEGMSAMPNSGPPVSSFSPNITPTWR